MSALCTILNWLLKKNKWLSCTATKDCVKNMKPSSLLIDDNVCKAFYIW